jgi:predicted nucleic acid-binding protein
MLKIYLDNCCYNRPFDDLSQAKIRDEATAKLFVQSLIKDGAIKLCYSYMSIAEILDCNIVYNKAQILDYINEVDAEYVGYDAARVVPLANEALQTGVKDKDANHTACAIIGNCDYFLTTDKRLLNYETDKLKLVNPIEFMKIWEALNNV